MNKQFWIFTLIAAFMTAAFSLVKGWGTMDVTFFGTLALLLPIVLKSVKRFAFTEGLHVNLWAHAYLLEYGLLYRWCTTAPVNSNGKFFGHRRSLVWCDVLDGGSYGIDSPWSYLLLQAR